MLNRFIIIISRTIRLAVNIIFANGIRVLNFLPIDIDPGVLNFSLHDGYMLIGSTPHMNSDHNRKAIREYLEENLTWDNIKKLMSNSKVKSIVNDGVKSFIKHPEVKEHMHALKNVIDLPELSDVREIFTKFISNY
jgi:hypothetical protein